MHRSIGLDELDRALTHLDETEGSRQYLELAYDDPRLDSELFSCSTRGIPSIHQGQSGNCRWRLSGGRALHAHWFRQARIVRFHIDRIDPERDPLGHLLADTYAGEGAVAGGVLAPMIFGLNPWTVLLGIGLGALTGAHIPDGAPQVWTITSIDYYGTIHMRRIPRGQAARFLPA